jgi:hypothetical protein
LGVERNWVRGRNCCHDRVKLVLDATVRMRCTARTVIAKIFKVLLMTAFAALVVKVTVFRSTATHPDSVVLFSLGAVIGVVGYLDARRRSAELKRLRVEKKQS